MHAVTSMLKARLKHHRKEIIVVREKYQRPGIKDLGAKWKIWYWDYSELPRKKRSKVWSKSAVPTRREAQYLADRYMERVNLRNNEPEQVPSDQETVASLFAKCEEKVWPHHKNSTRKFYRYLYNKYLLPGLGAQKLRKLRTLDLQDFFNAFDPRLSSKTIEHLHGCLRTHLQTAVTWEMIEKNPAVGVRLPRPKERKPTVLLTPMAIRRMLDILPEPTRSVVILIVLGSLRVGEALALRWRHVRADRVEIVERIYDGEIDDVKTQAGEREVFFDDRGMILAAFRTMWEKTKFRDPDSLVFCTRAGKPLGRRNLLRHVKAAAKKLKVDKTVDFRSFRTMHASLLSKTGARPELVRDSLGHTEVSLSQNVYTKTYVEERRGALNNVVDEIYSPQLAGTDENAAQWHSGSAPWVPQLGYPNSENQDSSTSSD